MMREELKEMMTAKDVKEYLGIGINEVYELVAQEKFKVFRLGRRIRIPKKEFLAWIDSEIK